MSGKNQTVSHVKNPNKLNRLKKILKKTYHERKFDNI